MAITKNSYGMDGKLRPKAREEYFRERLERQFRKMDKDDTFKNPPKQQKGIRTIVLYAYKNSGIEAAYKAAETANERIGKQVYTTEIVDSWIKEENEKER